MKKLIVVLLALITLISMFALVACNDVSSGTSGGGVNEEQEVDDSLSDYEGQIYAIYQTYVQHVEKEGKQPVSYEDWLKTIKGDKGEKGNDGNGIKKVEIDVFGRLVITLTDGTVLEPIVITSSTEHNHTFDDYVLFSDITTYCEDRLYYKVCTECNYMEWKHGAENDHDWEILTINPTCTSLGYDDKTCEVCQKQERDNYTEKKGHYWQNNYTSNGCEHWIECDTCDEIKDKEECTSDDFGVCVTCKSKINPTEGLEYELSEDNAYAMLVGYEGDDKNIIIAEEYENKPVTLVCDDVFKNNADITRVIIPNSIEEIGLRAFSECSSLETITIGVGLSSVAGNGFYNCSSIERVNYLGTIDQWASINFSSANSNPTYYSENLYIDGENVFEESIVISTETIGAYAFVGGTGLTQVTLSGAVKTVGTGAFYNCSSIERVNYLGTIDQWASINFSSTNSNPISTSQNLFINDINVLEGSIVVNADKIGDHAFYNCDTLTGVVLGDSVYSIGKYSFANCNLISKITIGESVKEIGLWAFSRCNAVTLIEFNAVSCDDFVDGNNIFSYLGQNTEGVALNFGDEVEKVPANMLGVATGVADSRTRAPKVTSILLGEKVESIGDNALSFSKITNIVIPSSVLKVGKSAFYESELLERVEFLGTLDQWASIEFGNQYGNPTYFAKNLYVDGINVLQGDIEINSEKIGSYAFYETDVTNVTFGNNVTSIGNYAFNNCANLSTLIIPDNVVEIGEYAFTSCDNVSSITIGKGVCNIGASAFSSCFMVTEINFNAKNCDDLTSSDQVFYDVGRYAGGIRVLFGDSVESIPSYLFYVASYMPKIINVTISNSVTSIGKNAFQNCKKLTKVIIGEGVTNIGERAFEDCTMLVTVEFNAINCADLDLGNYVFDNAGTSGDGITATFGDRVRHVPARLFYGGQYGVAPKVISVTIPENVTSIGASAFIKCGYLTEIIFNVKNCADIADGGAPFVLTGNASVVLGENVEYIPADLFNGVNMTTLELPSGVTGIGRCAFSNCKALVSITIQNSVTSIGQGAFLGCNALSAVYYKGAKTEWATLSDNVESSNDKLLSASIYYYVENEAELPTDGDNYWRYIEGVPTVWTNEN